MANQRQISKFVAGQLLDLHLQRAGRNQPKTVTEFRFRRIIDALGADNKIDYDLAIRRAFELSPDEEIPHEIRENFVKNFLQSKELDNSYLWLVKPPKALNPDGRLQFESTEQIADIADEVYAESGVQFLNSFRRVGQSLRSVVGLLDAINLNVGILHDAHTDNQHYFEKIKEELAKLVSGTHLRSKPHSDHRL